MDQPQGAAPIAAAISAASASASLASWSVEHAVYFTIAAAIAAVLSGFSAFFFYLVSTYFKIKYEHVEVRKVTADVVIKPGP